jgi:hypothetical protein
MPLAKTTIVRQLYCMKLIPTRELAANSGKVMEELEAEGVLVVTKDGKPRSILLPTSEATLMEDVRDCLYARARRALLKGHLAAASEGSSHLSMHEIDEEIRSSRRLRGARRKPKPGQP